MIGPLAGLADDVLGLFARYSGGLFGKNAPDYEAGTAGHSGVPSSSRMRRPGITGRWRVSRKKATAPPGTGPSSGDQLKARSLAT